MMEKSYEMQNYATLTNKNKSKIKETKTKKLFFDRRSKKALRRKKPQLIVYRSTTYPAAPLPPVASTKGLSC